MDSKGKSNAEVIYELLNKMKSGEKITFADIDECISTRSVLDSIAGENAVTIFYSGESEDFINNLSNNGGQNIRMIRRTEAFEFVANNDFQLIVEYAIRCEHPDQKFLCVLRQTQKEMHIHCVLMLMKQEFMLWMNWQNGLIMLKIRLKWEDIQRQS